MVGGEADIWVCAQCRSVNNLRSKQCYHCRTPKELAAVDPSAVDPTNRGQLRQIALPEFHGSRVEAVIASVLILAVGVIQVIVAIFQARLASVMVSEPGLFDDPTGALSPEIESMIVSTGVIGLGSIGAALIALAGWALWLSRVVTAMPALGLGYPAANGLMAFVENFVPVLNLLRVPAIVRDVIRRLEPEVGRGDALIFLAWIGLFGGFFLPRIGGWLSFGAESLEQAVRGGVVIQLISSGLVLMGAIFLVVLIWWIEGRIALRRAEQLAGDGAGPAAAAPAAAATTTLATPSTSEPRSAALAADPRQPTPVGTPTPYDPMAAPFAPQLVTAAAPPPTAPAAPFAPTPGAAAPAAPAVPGPLGSVAASPSPSDASLYRPITAATGGASTSTPVGRPADEQADVERFADARPAYPAAPPQPAQPVPAAQPAPTAQPARAAPVPAGPRLHLRIDDGKSITATLDGESERIKVAELQATARALARAEGSVLIATADSVDARLLAEQVSKIFADARVPTTTED